MRAFNQATSLYWAIQEDALKSLLAVLSREAGDIEGASHIRSSRDRAFESYIESLSGDDEADLKALHAVQGEKLAGTRKVSIRGKTAILRIEGVLIRRADFFSEVSGATSVERLAQDFTMALNNEAVDNIVLYIDSPGGELNGINEFAGMIYDARAKKKVTAYSGGTLASAAYWLASAAESITVNDTAVVGSIGVLCCYLDAKVAYGMAGFKEIEFISSQSPRKNLDPDSKEGREAIEATVDALAEIFVGSVAKYRGVTTKKVLENFGKGGVLVGQAAVTAGLVDKLGSFEQGLADAQPPPEAPIIPDGSDSKNTKEKGNASSQPAISAEEAAADATGETMNLDDVKAFFRGMSKEDREAAKRSLTEGEGASATEPPSQPVGSATASQPPSQPPAAVAPLGVSAAEVESLRAQNTANATRIEQMMREARERTADTFVTSQLTANKIVPAEEAALRDEYLQALNDDVQYPVAEGQTSRAAKIEARQTARPAHILTTEMLRNVPPNARVLESIEGTNPLEAAQKQAEAYADQRNADSRQAAHHSVN